MNAVIKISSILAVAGICLCFIDLHSMKRAPLSPEALEAKKVIKPSYNPDNVRRQEEENQGELKFEAGTNKPYYGMPLAVALATAQQGETKVSEAKKEKKVKKPSSKLSYDPRTAIYKEEKKMGPLKWSSEGEEFGQE